MRKEEVLEILLSMYETARYTEVLEYVSSFLEGKDKEKILEAKERIATEQSPLDAFRSVGLIDESTYRFLYIIAQRSIIDRRVIEQLLEDERFINDAKRRTRGALMMPSVVVVLVGMIGAFIIKNLHEKFGEMKKMGLEVQLPLEFLFAFIGSTFPLSMFLAPALLLFILYLAYKWRFRVPFRYARLAGIATQILYLRSAKVPYPEVFSSLADTYPEYRELFSVLAEDSREMRVTEVVEELMKIYPEHMRVVPMIKLMRGDEEGAWEYLSRSSREEFKISAEKEKEKLPLIAAFLVAVMILFPVVSTLLIVKEVLGKVSF